MLIVVEEFRNKRITFVIGNMQRDGAERVISILANYYCKKGWIVDIVTLLDCKCEYDLNENISLIPICRKNKSYYRNIIFWIKGIRKYVKSKKPERIVSFFARINILTLIACLGLKIRIIISERNDPAADGRSYFLRAATFIMYKFADGVVFQTLWAQSCFPKNIINKSSLIPNPIKVSACASEIKKKKIVSVGRLELQKNQSMLINAFNKIHDNYPEYTLHIYGEGKLRWTLTKQIQFLEIEEYVFLPGNVPDIHENIADAEMFVLSSDYEGLSNALLEAMMMGLPCISTDCAGSNEVIQNNVNGLLTPIGDADKLAECMKRLINDKEFSYKISKESQITSRKFHIDTVIRKWESIIEK